MSENVFEIHQKRINVLTLGDHPLAPGGVSRCLKEICHSLLVTEKFDIISFGGAMKHLSYDPVRTEEWKEHWTIYAVDGFGTPEMVRDALLQFKIDIVLMQSDPRFYDWFMLMDDEVRKNVPVVWYSIWDNYPDPFFARPWWSSVDYQVPISKVTDDIMSRVIPEVPRTRMPHCTDYNVFKPIGESERAIFKSANSKLDKEFVVYWHSKNGGRKHAATAIYCFKTFLEKTGADAVMLMGTDPHDQFGPDLVQVAKSANLEQRVIFATEKISDNALNLLHNASDVFLTISDAEGFGRGVSESLMAGTPVIGNLTGGIQEQIVDEESGEVFGIGIKPAAKAIVGSQQIPYIYEDRVAQEDVVNALEKMYKMTREDRKKLGLAGREYLIKNYNWDEYQKFWPELFLKINDEYGSWPNKKFQTHHLIKM